MAPQRVALRNAALRGAAFGDAALNLGNFLLLLVIQFTISLDRE